jgi:predicted CopG family antitoxin
MMPQALNIRVPLNVSMTIKSLTITEDAYDALKAMKHGDESFSEAILRVAKSRKEHIGRFFGILGREGAEALRRSITKRRLEIEKECRVREKKIRGVLSHGRS